MELRINRVRINRSRPVAVFFSEPLVNKYCWFYIFSPCFQETFCSFIFRRRFTQAISTPKHCSQYPPLHDVYLVNLNCDKAHREKVHERHQQQPPCASGTRRKGPPLARILLCGQEVSRNSSMFQLSTTRIKKTTQLFREQSVALPLGVRYTLSKTTATTRKKRKGNW